MSNDKIPLEFEGVVSLPETFAPGYDCRICMRLRGREEEIYEMRTKKDERLNENGTMVDTYKILVGEGTICLPDHNYAHADHSPEEIVIYAEYLQAVLPTDDYIRLDVARWANRKVLALLVNINT